MKQIKLFYWITTVLFGGFMLFSAVPDILMVPEAKAFITGLGYPDYIVPFLGVAKALGVIAILVPGYPRVKEWAYAGLFYDLIGATYSNYNVKGFEPGLWFMIVPFLFAGLSYGFYHQRLKAA